MWTYFNTASYPVQYCDRKPAECRRLPLEGQLALVVGRKPRHPPEPPEIPLQDNNPATMWQHRPHPCSTSRRLRNQRRNRLKYLMEVLSSVPRLDQRPQRTVIPHQSLHEHRMWASLPPSDMIPVRVPQDRNRSDQMRHPAVVACSSDLVQLPTD